MEDELRAERDALAAQVDELLYTKDWLYERWQARESELGEIHSSRMWWLWTRYHAVRRIVLLPLYPILNFRRVVDRALLVAGAVSVGFQSLVERARAGIRRVPEEPPPGTSERPALAEGLRPRVLLVMPYQIYPPNHGGGVRLFNLVRRLAEHVDLFVIVFSSCGEDEAQRRALEPYCVDLWFHHWRPHLQPDRLGRRPPNAQIFWAEEVADRIRTTVQQHDIDLVQIEYTELGQYIDAVPDSVPVLLTEHDIAFRTHRRRLRLGFHDRYPESRSFCGSFADVRRIFLYELAACRAADLVHVMSGDDGGYLARYLRDGWQRLRVAPNGVDCDGFAPTPGALPRHGVLFVGNFQNLPNQDALEFVATEVWPRVRQQCPHAILSVVGSHADERTAGHTGVNGIELIGEVPAVEPYYGSHRVMLAPIRAGSGTRLKILEAFAAGIPVVSTTLGAEGIACEPGRHLLIADDGARFADAIVQLLQDDTLHSSIAAAALDLARARYDWGCVTEELLASYAELLTRCPRPHDRPRRDRADVVPRVKLHPGPPPPAAGVLVDPPPGASGEALDASGEAGGVTPFDPEPLRPQVTRPLPIVASRGSDRPAVLVLGIYLAHRQNNVADTVRVLARARAFEVVQRWVALLGEPPSDEVAAVTAAVVGAPMPKGRILNSLLADVDLGSYRYVMVCDDDVVLPHDFIDQFLGLQERLEYRIAQPARTMNSFIDLPIVEQHPGVLARRTLFVEQGPVVSFHAATFDLVFPFDLTSPMGWGLENVWSLRLSERGLKMGIIDNVPVDHSMRKPVANYSWDEADRGRTRLFATVPHRPNEECFRVLDVVPFEGPR